MTNIKTAKIVKHEAHYGWNGQLELTGYWTVEIFENGERVNFARCSDYLYGECTFNEIKAFATEREALEWIETHDCELDMSCEELFDAFDATKNYSMVIDGCAEYVLERHTYDVFGSRKIKSVKIEKSYSQNRDYRVELELETDVDSEVKRYEDVIDALVESAQSVVRYNRLIEIAEEKDDESSEIMLESLTTKRDSAKNDYFVAVNTVSFIYGVDVSKIRSDVKYRREFLYD